MKRASHYKRQLKTYLKDYLHHPQVRKMQDFTQHGQTSTFAHVYHVTAMSLYINERFNLHVHEKHLATGALLHDFYLYDWHESPVALHGFRHPKIAAENAKKVFDINDDVAHIIQSHMWPLTFLHPPTTREAIIVCIADKICAVKETIREWSAATKLMWRKYLTKSS